MTQRNVLSAEILEKLRSLDSCTISNAIERLDVRPRNEGFISGALTCRFPQLGPMVGYAATGRIRTASPPTSRRCYYDRMDWWSYVATVPEPRILVLEDTDHKAGVGAFVGEIHAEIGRALHCVGCVTNGAVRDLPAVEAMGFHLFAGGVSVSHSYAHIIEFGEPVEIGSLKISSGDLLHGDRHGVLQVPLSTADKLPETAAQLMADETALIEYCQSPEFSLEELTVRIQKMSNMCDLPWRRG